MPGQEQQKQPTVLDAINNLFVGLEKAQKSGLYSFEESAKLFTSMTMTKQYFQKLVEQQQKVMAQKQSVQNKLNTIVEEI